VVPRIGLKAKQKRSRSPRGIKSPKVRPVIILSTLFQVTFILIYVLKFIVNAYRVLHIFHRLVLNRNAVIKYIQHIPCFSVTKLLALNGILSPLRNIYYIRK
jgi:hypothetical protein